MLFNVISISEVCPKRFELPNLPSAFCYSAVESAFPEGMTPEQYNDVVPGFCDQHKAGASIATINTQVEQNAIAELLDSGRVKIRDTVMLGLTKFPLKENESSDWKWVDGSPVTFTHWSDEWEAEGNKQQAVMFKALGWKWAPWNTNVPHMLCQYEMCAWREQKSPMECYPDYYY
ncbi:hypothetical protein QR680_010686 [Steinernema hermaphroditum]|uniref:C-type lectin domain-containing protein n=1 Tax=Steinernema hermaphroditum TaxID=289476 RepID=A0AA39IPT1_9BILA|nr:hypothetical protein QR680_010686 [Steinernema hermaphroditum]